MADAANTSADVTSAPSRARRMSLTVAVVYAVIGAAWILFSDMAVDALISDIGSQRPDYGLVGGQRCQTHVIGQSQSLQGGLSFRNQTG